MAEQLGEKIGKDCGIDEENIFLGLDIVRTIG
jgi:hypothetical protein